MPNLRLAPRVAATRARRPHRRAIRARRRGGGGWLEMIKVAWLLEHFRRRRSSPSVRQILLTVVSAGLAIVAIRAVTRQRKSPDGGEPAGVQDEAQKDGSTEPAPGNDTVASETKLTDRVQSEMFQRSHAPAPATESG